MTAFSTLVCGNLQGASGKLAACLAHLGATLETMEEGMEHCRISDRKFDKLMLPFVVRSALEIACTALVGRVDAFRLLTLAEMQSQSTYDPSVKLLSSFQWKGDVVADAIGQMWEAKRKAPEMSRALLGDYFDHVFWRPAALHFSDYVADLSPDRNVSDWERELLLVPPEGVTASLRGQALAVYSTASKGVHHEFVLPMAAYYDGSTLDEMCDVGTRLIATMGLLSAFCEHVAHPVSKAEALKCFEEVQR